MSTNPIPVPERVIVEAERVEQIASRLQAANVEVARRSQGRTHDQVEIYSIVRVLATRPYDPAQFPLKLVKRERPDFLLSLNGSEVGIEHTEAITQNQAKEAALRDSGVGPESHFIRPASLTEPVKSAKEIRKEIEADRMTPGWCGDSVERGWVEAMTYFVVKKFQLLQRPDYPRFERTWLVVYDQWPAPSLVLSKALPQLRSSLDSLPTWSLFDQVLILRGRELIDVDSRSIYVYCVNHL